MLGLKLKHFVLNPKSRAKDDMYARAKRKAMITYTNHINNILNNGPTELNNIDYDLAKKLLDCAEKETR